MVVVASRFFGWLFGWLVGWLVVDSVVFHVNGDDVDVDVDVDIPHSIPSLPVVVVVKPHVRYTHPYQSCLVGR